MAKGKKTVPAMSPAAYSAALEAYCLAARDAVEAQHGKPTGFQVSWIDGPFWCRAFNLGWTAEVKRRFHTRKWEDALDLEEFDRAPFRALAARHPAMRAFFRQDGRDALKGEWEIPGGEFGAWVCAVYDQAVLDVQARLGRTPRFKGLDFAIGEHDGGAPFAVDHWLDEVRERRAAGGDYAPPDRFLAEFFALLCPGDRKDAARWTELAGGLARPQAAGGYSFLIRTKSPQIESLPSALARLTRKLMTGQPAAAKVAPGTELVVASDYEVKKCGDAILWDDPKTGASGGLLVSRRFKDILDRSGRAEIEFCEVRLLHRYGNAKPVPAGGDWYLANVLSSADCLDAKKSVLGRDDRHILVLDESRIDPAWNLFRLTARPGVLVIRSDLRAELEKAKMTGVAFLALDRKAQDDYWGPM